MRAPRAVGRRSVPLELRQPADEMIEAARERLVAAALELRPGRRPYLRLVAFRVKAAALLLQLAAER